MTASVMVETIKLLKGDFVALDLGSAHSRDLFRDHSDLAGAVTFIEVDALSQEPKSDAPFHRRISLKKAVAGTPGKRILTQRKFPDCSSFPEPDPELIEAYGLQSYFEKVGTIELECETIGTLLREHGISRVDLFKTDLEGMDFEVLSSARELVSRALCVQSELRFQPFYRGEPHYHEVAAYLAELGFETIFLRPEIWKYATRHQSLARDGRLAWCDAIFFMKAGKVRQIFGEPAATKCFLKQIILARLLGLNNFAEYLYQTHATQFPDSVRREMQDFFRQGFGASRRLIALINRLPLGWMFIAAMRRVFGAGYRATCLYRDKMIATQ
jgi:hypothetical protein